MPYIYTCVDMLTLDATDVINVLLSNNGSNEVQVFEKLIIASSGMCNSHLFCTFHIINLLDVCIILDNGYASLLDWVVLLLANNMLMNWNITI